MFSEADWKSDDLFLQGNFAPVMDELDVADLPVQGAIPADLFGVYMRNGPNPQFKPLSYTYPFDGDGMIHAVYFENGVARYRNRFVKTKALLTERRAGRALYGGTLGPVPVDPKLLQPGDEPGPDKNGAFVHVIRHAGTYLALLETTPAYEIGNDLETKGLWCPDGPEPIKVNAHTRWDPQTGELFMMCYDLERPHVSLYRFDQKGLLRATRVLEKSHITMIHDFLLTPAFIVLFECPMVFDFAAMAKGGNILQWQPELGTRVGLIPRASEAAEIRWITTDPCFVFHFANAYERDSKIIMDYARHGALVLGAKVEGEHPPYLYRSVLDLETGEIKSEQRDDHVVEFPRIREDRNSLSNRYIYQPAYVGEPQPEDRFRMLIKYDMDTGKIHSHDFGAACEIGEAVFAPRTGGREEDAGYVMLFVYDKSQQSSDLVILDARNFSGKPLARIRMPRRVPHGLHGSWMPGSWS